jgi:iron(III) transport system permease protein
METMSTAIYNQLMGGNGVNAPYRASAMSLVLLGISMTIFFVQKYVFERKTVATLTGKASRQRMLIEDKSVTIPLSTFCTLISLFVIILYGTVIAVPSGLTCPIIPLPGTTGKRFSPAMV